MFKLNGKTQPTDTEPTLTERVGTLKNRAHAEDERERMLGIGSDLEGADLHARAVFSLRERGRFDYTADEYARAVEDARREDEYAEPVKSRKTPDELHEAALALLKSRGIDKPDYETYAGALMEVA